VPRILIVDDDVLVRRNLRSLVTKQSDWHISEAGDAKAAIETLRLEKPDVVVLDILMPSGNGLMAAYEIRQLAPQTKVLFLTDQCGPHEASAIARLLGSGEFVPKADMKTHLVPSITRLLKGPEESLPEIGVLPGAPPTERKMRSV
jgi:DNA-binding NarL/FixJ family response regulator